VRIFANSARRKIARTFSFFNPYPTLSTKNVRNCLLRTTVFNLLSESKIYSSVLFGFWTPSFWHRFRVCTLPQKFWRQFEIFFSRQFISFFKYLSNDTLCVIIRPQLPTLNAKQRSESIARTIAYRSSTMHFSRESPTSVAKIARPLAGKRTGNNFPCTLESCDFQQLKETLACTFPLWSKPLS
jgi:hypothetical protein